MKKLLLMLFTLAVISCSSVRKAEAENKMAVLAPDAADKQLLGTYCNIASNGPYEIYSLWSTLVYNSRKKDNWQDLKVRLVLDQEKKLIAELIDNDDTILESKVLKGKYTDNFYYLKHQYKADFKYILIWFWGDSNVKIGLTLDNELVTIRQSGGFAMLGIAPCFAAESPIVETVYARIYK